MRRVAWWLLLTIGCASAPPETPPPSTTTQTATGDERVAAADARDDTTSESTLPALPGPADRRGRSRPTTETALAEGEGAYPRLNAAPIGFTDPPATFQTATDEFAAQLHVATSIVNEILTSSSAAAQDDAALRASALTLSADAADLLGSRIASAPMPLTLDLVARLQRLSPADQAGVTTRFHARMATALQSSAHISYCVAVRLYRGVLAVEPANPRATSQLAAYGDDFVRSCP